VGSKTDEAQRVNWPAFYREQGRLMWEWRATRLAQIRRVALSVLAAMAALQIIVWISPDLTLQGPASLALAGLLLAVLNGLARPALMFVLSPLAAFVVPIAGLILEVPIVIAVGSIVPGVGIRGLDAAVRDAIMLTILNAIFSEILRASDDDSYHGTQVRRLAAAAFGKPRAERPGLLMIQIDGLSLPVLVNAMRAGRMPALDRLVRSGHSQLDPWFAMLPPVTPVSQAGILHGNNDEMPGFRWFEKRSENLLVANTPEGASEIERRRSDGHGLLADDGASIGNLVDGDAPRSYLTMATITDDRPKPDYPRQLRGIVISQVNYLRLLVLTIGEIAKELYQRERQRGRGVEPRIRRDIHYAFERALTNVALRNLATALVIEEMFGGASAIYVDYTGYDALAHHVGPERTEAMDALDGLDRTIGALIKAARETPRAYRLIVLSDHGQCLSVPFEQRFGEKLEDVARRLMGDGTGGVWTSTIHEYNGMGRMILGEIGRGRGVRPAIARRAARQHAAIAAAADKWELVACASGNLVLLYLTLSDDRVDREMIDEHYPDLIPGLLAHPGVGVILAHSAVNGPIVLGRSGEHYLTSGRVVGDDPLAVYGPLAVDGLTRLDRFRNAGDLTVIGPYDAESGEVVSYEELVGSHGGLGGRQGEPFLLHPVDLPLTEGPIIGAPAVNAQLRVWLEILQSGQLIAPAKQVEGPTSSEDDPAHRPARDPHPVSAPGQPVGASRATGTPPT
jgi:uncharacterized membrane protein YvlD (DUF360 family)